MRTAKKQVARDDEFPTGSPAAGGTSEGGRLVRRLENLKECFRISSLINSSLELDEVLQNIMTTSRSILNADACSLMLVDEKTGELVFEVAQGPVAHMLTGKVRIRKGQGIAGHVFETGEPVLIEDAYSDSRFSREFDKMTGYRTRSILCVPLKIKDRVIGVSQIINKLDGSPFNSEDEETISLFCNNAAVAIENARLHREMMRKQQIDQDLAFAASIQLSFLPQEMPQFEGFRFASYYQAAREVGGDFYDFIPLDDDKMGILIGDVSGKGVASALFMARLTSDFRLLAVREKEPERLIRRINNRICDQSCRGMFVTLLYMVLTRGSSEVSYINAGHLPPVLWNKSENRYAVLQGGGPPLGILPDTAFAANTVSLSRGDCVMLATDGLIEAKCEDGTRLGWEKLEEVVKSGDSDIESVKARISRALDEFVKGCPQADDTTIVLVGVEEG